MTISKKYWQTALTEWIIASKSDCEFIKKSIINSGFLNAIGISEENIDWDKCDKFATSNLYKMISEYRENHLTESAREVAQNFKVSKNLVWRATNKGLKHGWCTHTIIDSAKIRSKNGLVNHNQKPIYCITNDNYYRSSSDVCEHLTSVTDDEFYPRQVRQSIARNHKYKGYKFEYISQEEFNLAKSKTPDKCHGNFFNIKEKTA